LSAASGNQFVVERHRSGIRAGNPLYIIKKNGPPGPPPAEVTVEALNLAGYMEHMKFEAVSRQGVSGPVQDTNVDEHLAKIDEIIRDAVAVQQSFTSESKPPVIRFYKDADLLIVIGSPEAAETARKIVNALPGQINVSASQPGGRTLNDSDNKALQQLLKLLRTGVGSQSPAPAPQQNSP
jgi:hypothetical protein